MNKAIWTPSPNFSKREKPIQYIILHGTWMNTAQEALERLCSEEAEVSCHYFIDEAGQIYQLVKDENVAWHAGISAWGNDVSLNQTSIGIELANKGDGSAYTEAQYKALIPLLEHLLKTYTIKPKNVLAHSDIAPDRKDDPGVSFNWQKLYEMGVAEPLSNSTNPSYEALQKIGYVGEEAVVLKAYALRCV